MLSSAQASLAGPCRVIPLPQSSARQCAFRSTALRSPKRQAVRQLRRGARQTVAALESEYILAVTQQSLLFAAVTVGETYLSRQALFENSPGRPGWVTTAAGAAGVVAAVALVQSEGAVQQAGLALGTAVTGGLLYRSVKRFQNTPDDPADWPGPKVW
eukprot:CAMPEP_0206135844 /NCGR_PEP_ID=MMETSP1473-20131121/1104_1 /ASSEMBLY_ACC=CAM_ASM_001109 /TAXON_ID=1461547 /ORGANISM="Stichococcus sp, Strain RCC1054" /LENGTH=157 /DNA_ID=CAMNT_0053527963 /DNA_START=131 /DNA_END=601 /DNA_ORIENTATION=-